MLYTHPSHELFRILAIDPGTDTLGISLIGIDLLTQEKQVLFSYTFEASKYIDGLVDNVQWRGIDEKYLRLYRHGEHLYGVLLHYQPHLVVYESAFMGRFPKAYQGLVECLSSLRQAVFRYSPYIPFIGITPMEVKYAIGGVKKDEVLRALRHVKDVVNLDEVLPHLDEHAVDSLAIGITKARQFQQDYLSWQI